MKCLNDWQLKISNLLQIGCFLGLTLAFSSCVAPQGPDIEQERQALALVDKGTWYLRQGNLEQAQAAFEVANQIALSAQAYDGLGSVAMLQDQYKSAEIYFKRALQIDPNYTEALGNLALLYDQWQRTALASRYYSLALKADPANFRVRNNQAVFELEQGGGRSRAKHALFSAKALFDHPIIEKNLLVLEKDVPNG